jgi:hypothetical protein
MYFRMFFWRSDNLRVTAVPTFPCLEQAFDLL